MKISPTGRVLVLGDNDRAGLTTVRALGRAGLEVHLVAFESGAATRRSRFVHRIHRLGQPLEEGERFAQRLLDLLGSRRFDLVLPTADKALVPLMPWRKEIADRACLAAPDEKGFEATYYKHVTISIARRLGIPTPRTRILRSAADLGRLKDLYPFPVVLKPSCNIIAGRSGRNEVRIVRTEDELRDLLPPMLARCPVLVQEFCRGEGVGINVLAKDGELVAAFQHRRVHEPVDGGASSYRVSVPLAADLLDAARRFCRELRWTGPAMLEFKRDPATGATALMEVNGRLWGSLALAVQAGVNFPRLLYEMLVLGRATPTFTYRVPCYVRHTTADFDWLLTQLRSARGRQALRQVAWQREIGHFLGRREGYDLEAADDPLPAAVAWLDLARTMGHKLCRRMADWSEAQAATRQALDRPALLRAVSAAGSVLFVCHGNINRSAFAEKKLLGLLGGTARLRVASAGLIPEAGRPTGATSHAVAAELGVQLSGHRSTALTPELLEQFDLVFYMEPAHRAALGRMNPQAMSKCFPLAALESRGPVTIPDPEGQGRDVFRATYGRIAVCVSELAGLVGKKAA